MVGLSIEISNLFLHDLEAATYFAKQCKTRSCHKSPFVKGGFRGNVNVTEDISPPPPLQKRGETVKFLLFSSGGRTRTSDLRVMSPTSCQLLYPAMYREWLSSLILLIASAKISQKFFTCKYLFKIFTYFNFVKTSSIYKSNH